MKPEHPRTRALLAFLAGIAIYRLVVVDVGGVLSAVAVPSAYFEAFGRAHVDVGLAVLYTALAVPILALVAAATLLVLRALGGYGPALPMFVLAGLITGFVCVVFIAVFVVRHDLPVPSFSLATRLHQLLTPPWWAWPGYLRLGSALRPPSAWRAGGHRSLHDAHRHRRPHPTLRPRAAQ